ncbi:MAG: hypothetical protein Q8K58_14070 [Acidimicrobiales bacterium]|nr:hypothetical protein [Acidimicrobiales bacterium]
MARQLTLLDTPPSWRLDEATRSAGRKGVADARATLRAAIAGHPADEASSTPAPATPRSTRSARPKRQEGTRRRTAA